VEGLIGCARKIDISESKWIHGVIEYLFRNLVECLLNDLDYLVADSWVHSPYEDYQNKHKDKSGSMYFLLLLVYMCISDRSSSHRRGRFLSSFQEILNNVLYSSYLS